MKLGFSEKLSIVLFISVIFFFLLAAIFGTSLTQKNTLATIVIPTVVTTPQCPVGDVYIYCFIDKDGDAEYDATETGVQCTVLLKYHGDQPSKIVTAGPQGIWAGAVIPGVYQVIFQNWSSKIDVMPVVIYPLWAIVSSGDSVQVHIPFVEEIIPTPTPISSPTITRTPTATATPTTVFSCPNYSANCMKVPVCPDGRVLEPRGECQIGFLCCLPVTQTTTPTVTPTATNTTTSTVTPTETRTMTPTSTSTMTSIPTNTASHTSTSTTTATPSNTPTSSSTSTATLTPIPTDTATEIPTATATNTEIPTNTTTATPTITQTETPTVTNTPTSTLTPSHTSTSTPTETATSTGTPTATVVVGSLTISQIIDNVDSFPGRVVSANEKLEVTFRVDNTVATNFQFPYDENPPSGVIPRIGISVNGLFTPDNWQTVYRQPAFYYQDFDYAVKNGKDWVYPNGGYVWKVRFAPDRPGAWQYRLIAQDASGSAQSVDRLFSVGASNNPGFVRLSAADSRYFEFSNGSYFPGLGYNMNWDHIDWKNPVTANAANFATMGQNGIQLIRMWLSEWSIFEANWNPWRFVGDNPNWTYLFTTEPQANGGVSVRLAQGVGENPCLSSGHWLSSPIALKRNTQYAVSIRAKAIGVTGPRIASAQKYGLTAKITTDWNSWLWGAGNNCNDPGVGRVVAGYLLGDSAWTEITGTFNSETNDFLTSFYVAIENATAGQVYIDQMMVREILGNEQYGPNILIKPTTNHHEYFDQTLSFAFDKVLDLAHQNGVYLRPVILEKNDIIFNQIDASGNFTTSMSNDNFYGGVNGSARQVGKARWLHQAWWRYLQARWGYSTNIQSWELLNEGDPFSGYHYDMTDEFGKYMHCTVFGVAVGAGSGQKCTFDHPNDHLVSTSNWHSFPASGFWNNADYPNVDFADYHQYVAKNNDATHFYDTALMTYDVSMTYGAKQPSGAQKPIIRGETGLTDSGTAPESRDVLADVNGIWLHNFIWGQINSGGMLESYWYDTQHIYAVNDYRPIFNRYYTFIKDVPLNNGHYADTAAVSVADIRAWGQKDVVNGNAHLWIANKNHTWKAVVDNVVIVPITAIVTVPAMMQGTYLVEWYDTYSASVIRTETMTVGGDGNANLAVANLTTDIAVKLSRIGGVTVTPTSIATSTQTPTPTPVVETASWSMSGGNIERTSYTSEEVRGNLSPEWYRPIEPYIQAKSQLILANDMVFASTARGLYALAADSGVLRWVYATEMPLGNSPTVNNGVAYVGGFDKKLYAIDVNTGIKLWSYDGAGAGYETNPLVVNGLVMLGNRDGYFYAIHANESAQRGQLAWRYKTDGPILYSAAYSNGSVFFAANDSYAYALNSNDGSLLWKKHLPTGDGFHSWWPVVVGDSVVFTVSRGYRHATSPYNTQNLEMLYDPGVTVNAVSGGIQDITPNLSYFNTKTYRKVHHLLSATTGQEVTTMPFLRDGTTSSGTPFTVAYHPDGTIYATTRLTNGQVIDRGQVVGWRVGSNSVTVGRATTNADDEPLAFSIGGNVVYWNLCCDRESGSFVRTGGSEWNWVSYNMDALAPGYDVFYLGSNVSLGDLNKVYGGWNGVYGVHGDQNPPIAYKGRVYMHRSNAIIAFSTTGGSRNLGALYTVTVTETKPAVDVSVLRQRLDEEVQKIIAAGHLRPGYSPEGYFSRLGKYDLGDNLSDYWSTSADTLWYLAEALPHVSITTQQSLRAYLQSEFALYAPNATYSYNHTGYATGASREAFDLPPEVSADLPNSPMTQWREDNFAGWPNPDYSGWPPYLFHALWKYAEVFGNARTIFDNNRDRLQTIPADSVFVDFPQALNAWIIGYRGYMELERIAGYTGAITASSKYAEYQRLLNLRVTTFTKDNPWGPDAYNYQQAMSIARNFMYMTPELGAYLRANALTKVTEAVNEYHSAAPYWFVTKFEATFAEGVIQHLYDYNAMFAAKALILNESADELTRYLDVPAFARGDLFYIHNLVLILAVTP